MIDHMKSNCRRVLILIIALVASGCAGAVKNMQSYDGDESTIAPENGKAMIVFMRPATLGFAIQSSVFRVTDNDPDLAGIVAAKMKVAYQVEPGEHLFMVIGESADFMSAEVEAGKTYYARVTPRMGAWKARFSLDPVNRSDEEFEKLDGWVQACDWVEKNADSESWAADNMPSVVSKQTEYYVKWMEKDEVDRPRLTRADGT